MVFTPFFEVPSAGVEPAHPKILVFETNASTNSASWASVMLFDDANISLLAMFTKIFSPLSVNYLIIKQ